MPAVAATSITTVAPTSTRRSTRVRPSGCFGAMGDASCSGGSGAVVGMATGGGVFISLAVMSGTSDRGELECGDRESGGDEDPGGEEPSDPQSGASDVAVGGAEVAQLDHRIGCPPVPAAGDHVLADEAVR